MMSGESFSYHINHHAELLHSFTLRLMTFLTSSFIHVASEHFCLIMATVFIDIFSVSLKKTACKNRWIM